jgi:hypothetical protein
MLAKRLVFMLLSMLILPLGQADVSGEWSVKGSFDADSVARGLPSHADLICTFEREAAALTGSCRPSDGPGGAPVQGRVEGLHVEWHFDIALEPHGKKQTVTYAGLLNDRHTSMKGTVAIADMRGEFTAEKQ